MTPPAAPGWLCGGVARADWVNLSGAENAANIVEIRVTTDQVRIELEIFVGDVATFAPQAS